MKPATLKAALLCASAIQVAALSDTVQSHQDSEIQTLARRDEVVVAESSVSSGAQDRDTTIITVGDANGVTTAEIENGKHPETGGGEPSGHSSPAQEKPSSSTSQEEVVLSKESEKGGSNNSPAFQNIAPVATPKRVIVKQPVVPQRTQAAAVVARPPPKQNILTRAPGPKGTTSYTKTINIIASSKDSRATAAPAPHVQAAPAPKQPPQAAPAPRQPVQAAPAPKQSAQAAPAQKQPVQAAPAPKQHVQAAPAPKQPVQAAPAPKQPVNAPADRIVGQTYTKHAPTKATRTIQPTSRPSAAAIKPAPPVRPIAAVKPAPMPVKAVPGSQATVTPGRLDTNAFLSRIFGGGAKKAKADASEQKTGGKNGVAISDGAISKNEGAAAPGGSAQKLIGEMFGNGDSLGIRKKPKKGLFNAKEEISKDRALSSTQAAHPPTRIAAVAAPTPSVEITVTEERKGSEFEANIVLKDGADVDVESIVTGAMREPERDEHMDAVLGDAEAWLSRRPISNPAPASLKHIVKPEAPSSSFVAPVAPRFGARFSGSVSKPQTTHPAAHSVRTVTVYGPPPGASSSVDSHHGKSSATAVHSAELYSTHSAPSVMESRPSSVDVPQYAHVESSSAKAPAITNTHHSLTQKRAVWTAPVPMPAATQRPQVAVAQKISEEVAQGKIGKKEGLAAQPFSGNKGADHPLTGYTDDKPMDKKNSAIGLLESIDSSNPAAPPSLSGPAAIIANEEDRESKEKTPADGKGTTGDDGMAVSYRKNRDAQIKDSVLDLFGDKPKGTDALDRIPGDVKVATADAAAGNGPKAKAKERVGINPVTHDRSAQSNGNLPPDMVFVGNQGQQRRKSDRPLDPEFLESASPSLVNKFTDVSMSKGKAGAAGDAEKVEGDRIFMEGGPNNLLDFEGFKRPDGGFEGYVMQRQPLGLHPGPPRLSDFEGGPEYDEYMDGLDYPYDGYGDYYPEPPSVPIAHIVVNNYNDIKNTNENQNDNAITNTNDNRIANDLAADASAKNEATTFNDNSVSSDNRAFSFNDNSAVNNLNDYMFQDNKYYSFQDLSSNDVIQHIYPQPIFINKKEFKTILPGDNEYVTVNSDCSCYTKKACDICTPVTAYLPKASMPPIPEIPEDMVRVGYTYDGLVRDSDQAYQRQRAKKGQVQEDAKAGKTYVNDAQAHVVQVHDEWIGDGVTEQSLLASKVVNENNYDDDSEWETDTDDEDEIVDYAVKEEFKEEVVANCEEDVTPEAIVVAEPECERMTRTKVHRVTMPIVVRTRVARVPRMKCRTPPAASTQVCEQTLDTFTQTHTITPAPEASPVFEDVTQVPIEVLPTVVPVQLPVYNEAVPTQAPLAIIPAQTVQVDASPVWVPASTAGVVTKPIKEAPPPVYQAAETLSVGEAEPITYVHKTIRSTLPASTRTIINRVTITPDPEIFVYTPPPVTITQFQEPVTKRITEEGHVVTTTITPEPVTVIETHEPITVPYHTTITAPIPLVREFKPEIVTQLKDRIYTVTPEALTEVITSTEEVEPVTITRRPRPVTIAKPLANDWLPAWYTPEPTPIFENDARVEGVPLKKRSWFAGKKQDEKIQSVPVHEKAKTRVHSGELNFIVTEDGQFQEMGTFEDADGAVWSYIASPISSTGKATPTVHADHGRLKKHLHTTVKPVQKPAHTSKVLKPIETTTPDNGAWVDKHEGWFNWSPWGNRKPTSVIAPPPIQTVVYEVATPSHTTTAESFQAVKTAASTPTTSTAPRRSWFDSWFSKDSQDSKDSHDSNESHDSESNDSHVSHHAHAHATHLPPLPDQLEMGIEKPESLPLEFNNFRILPPDEANALFGSDAPPPAHESSSEESDRLAQFERFVRSHQANRGDPEPELDLLTPDNLEERMAELADQVHAAGLIAQQSEPEDFHAESMTEEEPVEVAHTNAKRDFPAPERTFGRYGNLELVPTEMEGMFRLWHDDRWLAVQHMAELYPELYSAAEEV